MAAQAIENPLSNFNGANGLPLSNGYVYFGEPELDPITNPITVYYDEAMTLPVTQPIRTTAGYLYRNGTPTRVWVNGNYSTLVQDATRRQVFYAPNWSAASSANVAFLQSGVGAILRSLQAKGRDIINVFDFNGVVGDGVNDDTAGLQACFDAHPGAEINLGNDKTLLISASLVMRDGTTYRGRSKIKAKANAAIADAMLLGTGLSGVVVEDLDIDGNKSGNGGRYGVKFIGGSRNFGRNLRVHDTIQAGGVIWGESGSFFEAGCTFDDCGDNTGTDNHGVMIVSTATTTQAIGARDCRVDAAYRKGIAAYTAIGGSVKYLSVTGNQVSSCGLGGIYLGNEPGATDMEEATLSNNICWSNYVNFNIDNIRRISGSGNVSYDSTAQGVVMNGCREGNMPGFIISDSGDYGLWMVDCVAVAMGCLSIIRSNRNSAGFGPALFLDDSTYCSFGAGSILYDDTPLTTHAIIEQGTSDYNDFTDITVVGYTAAAYTRAGANSRFRTRAGRNTGFGAIVPANFIDNEGGMSERPQILTLVLGANQDVVLPDKAGTLVSNAPAGAYNIGGIAGGAAGRLITIYNYTGSNMTINHNDGGSLAANRIICPSNANQVVPTLGSITLQYITVSGLANWLVKSEAS